jgi:hypothetical protein
MHTCIYFPVIEAKYILQQTALLAAFDTEKIFLCDDGTV